MALFDSRQSQFSVIRSVEEIPDNTMHMIQRTNRSKHFKTSRTYMAECYPSSGTVNFVQFKFSAIC